MNIKKSILIRVRLTFLGVFLVACGVVFRIFYIQYIEGSHWRAKHESTKKMPLMAMRGNIYSDNGSLLATSLPYYRLAFDPTVPKPSKNKKINFEKQIDSLCDKLATKFKDRDKAFYKRAIWDNRKLNKHFLYLSRAHQLTYRDKQEMLTWPIFKAGRYKSGVIFEPVYKRFRPFSELAGRTVGFLNEDNWGVGIEASFNNYLKGQEGQATFQNVSGNIYRPVFDGTEIRPVNGLDVFSTLNVNIQDVAQASLLKHLKKWNAKFGTVVVMETKTGEIKAMANYRLKNLDKPDSQYVDTYNYAVGLKTDPGSTFKLASYMALLEDGKINIQETINTGNGSCTFHGREMYDASYEKGGYGTITLKQAFEKSSNIAVMKLIEKHYNRNPEKFIEHLTRFGITEPLNFQIKGEQRPIIKNTSNDTWSKTTLPWMSIGYEVEISPLQMLAFYNAVANDGKFIQPIIVKEIRKNDEVVKSFSPNVIREKICSDETMTTLRQMMEGVVENGTAKNIKNEHYKIAGKTGTAQKIIDGVYTRKYFTSFIGYFPADAPKYSAIVVIDSPEGYNRMAADVAAPVFKEVADKIYATDVEMHKPVKEQPNGNLNGFPTILAGSYQDLNFLCNRLGISNHKSGKNVQPTSNTEHWVRPGFIKNSIRWQNESAKMGQVPNVAGMALKDALFLMGTQKYKAKIIGKGRVLSQFPKAYSSYREGSIVLLKLG